ncbi:MAG: hypothetical protein IJQ93_01745 [Bacteroidales bacterium]|nr:hypothetical protein [Bacteroidales bacterium]
MTKRIYQAPTCDWSEFRTGNALLSVSDNASIPDLAEGSVPTDLWD